MMKTLRELLDYRDNFVKNNPNDERNERLTDLFIVYMYMSQDDINPDDVESVSKIISNNLKDRVTNE